MPGPLPNPDRVRRNAPTIPTTTLPVSGRKGPAPKVPSWVTLGKAGRAWWVWAWKTPQSCAWGVGAGQESVVARRATLEDRLADPDAPVLQLLREMRELDDRLGLTPKGLEALRWKIVADEAPVTKAPAGVPSLDARRARLTENAS